jgi:multiple sugar transport system ATP-binding protein
MKELAADVGAEDARTLEQRAQQGENEFVAQLDPKSKIKEGEAAELVIDTSRLHFFDPETSRAIYDQK